MDGKDDGEAVMRVARYIWSPNQCKPLVVASLLFHMIVFTLLLTARFEF